MDSNERIAIFGGSFNPVHNAHIKLTRKIAQELSLNRIFAVPTYLTPLKNNGHMVLPQHRLNMCRLAWDGDSVVAVSDIEIKRGGKSYTVDTLKEFADIYKKSELYLIVGADMFMTLQKWYKFSEIISIAKVVTAPRDDKDYNVLLSQSRLLEREGAQCVILKEPIMILSSTVIRERLKAGKDVRGLMPESVISYIKAHNLYTE